MHWNWCHHEKWKDHTDSHLKEKLHGRWWSRGRWWDYKARTARDDQQPASGWERVLTQMLPHSLRSWAQAHSKFLLPGLFSLWRAPSKPPAVKTRPQAHSEHNGCGKPQISDLFFLLPHEDSSIILSEFYLRKQWYWKTRHFLMKAQGKRQFSHTSLRKSDKGLNNSLVKQETYSMEIQ